MGPLVSDDFSWKETKPGRWERDIDEVEQFYTSLAKTYEGSGRNYFAITGYISFSVAVDGATSKQETEERLEEALQKAWIRLRYDHPTIGARVEYNVEQKKCKKVYETFTEAFPQQVWLDSTFRTISSGLSGLEWCNSDPPVPDVPTLFLIKSPSSVNDRVHADLVLRCHHDIIDGMGTLLLFNNLFVHAAQAYSGQSQFSAPEFGHEWVNLSPPLRTAAGILPILQPKQKARFDEIIEYNISIKNEAEIASVPFKSGATIPGKHQRVAIKLSTEQTRRILEACRILGLSVTHAYHTGIAVTVRDVQERRNQERQVRYINYCLINLRGNCISPYNSPLHAASVYHSSSGRTLAIDLTVPAQDTPADGDEARTDEFMEIANKVRNFYIRLRNDKDHIHMIPSYWKMSIIPYPSDGVTPPVPEPNMSPSVSISSLGTIEKVICPKQGVFDLEDPWVTGEELGTGLGLFLGSWKGQITLSAAYNDAWHDRDEVLEFLERCNRVTTQALGV